MNAILKVLASLSAALTVMLVITINNPAHAQYAHGLDSWPTGWPSETAFGGENLNNRTSDFLGFTRFEGLRILINKPDTSNKTTAITN